LFDIDLADDPDTWQAASPTWRLHADAPPMFVVHGDRDEIVSVNQGPPVRRKRTGGVPAGVRLRGTPVCAPRLRHRGLSPNEGHGPGGRPVPGQGQDTFVTPHFPDDAG